MHSWLEMTSFTGYVEIWHMLMLICCEKKNTIWLMLICYEKKTLFDGERGKVKTSDSVIQQLMKQRNL
jgi:hypothetical protein